MSAPYSSLAIANTFIEIAHNNSCDISPIKVQKLMYFAHGWHLALKNAPLLREPIEAFPCGPVIGSLYEELLCFGCDDITGPIPQVVKDDRHIIVPLVTSASDSYVRAILERVWKVYGQYSEKCLAGHLTRHGGPWHQTRTLGFRYLEDNELAAEFVSALG